MAVKSKAAQLNNNPSIASTRLKVEVGTFAFDSSYPTGGEDFTVDGFTAVYVDFTSIGGYVFAWDSTNNKVMAYYADYDAVADGVLIQVANATDLAALTAVPYVAIGF